MIRWLLVTALALFLFSGLMPWLRKFGIGRLPGDLNFRWLGRDWSVPLSSTVLLSVIAMAVAQIL